MKVLYIHMAGAFGGASRSLYEAVRSFPAGAVTPVFVAPHGSVLDFFSRLGEVIVARGISQFDNTRYGHYRGLRWLILLREMAYLPFTLAALIRAKRRWPDADLVHVNEITGIVPWLLARRLFNVPIVLHVRSVAQEGSTSLRSQWIDRLVRTRADAVVAIDDTVRNSLPKDWPVSVVHNGFSAAAKTEGVADLKARLGLDPESFKIGFVGNFLRVKGIQELVEAARLTRDRGLNVEFIVVGGDAGSSEGIKARILNAVGLGQNLGAEFKASIEAHGLQDRFHLTGFMPDVARAYGLMDVLCFPSHYDAPGRPIFEAAFLKVPSIAAIQHPTPDTLVNGVTGIAIAPRDAGALADAIEQLAKNPSLVVSMGEAAYQMAISTFDPVANAARLLAIYRDVIDRRSRT